MVLLHFFFFFFFVGRDHILLSMCPEVFGMYVTKLAVAMVLAGGVQRIDRSGTKIRGIGLILSQPNGYP